MKTRTSTHMALLLAALGVPGGCSPPNREARLATREVAAGERWRQALFEASDGTKLFRQSWHPEREPKAALVIQHGLKSHGGDYAALAQSLTERGFAVYAADMRGHGRSEGPRALLDDFDQLVRDLHETVRQARSEVPEPAPLFLMGHSVGGALSTLYAERQGALLDGLIVLAPALRLDRPALAAAGTPVMGALFPSAPLVDIPDEWFSRRQTRRTEMAESDLVYHAPGPARTGAALLEALEEVWARADSIRVPLLAMHGTADLATDPRGSVELVERARSNDKRVFLYRGLYHDLLHEPERAQVAEDIALWLESHSEAP
jgi:acylglycerol lipase